jgi:hypothetical protein
VKLAAVGLVVGIAVAIVVTRLMTSSFTKCHRPIQPFSIRRRGIDDGRFFRIPDPFLEGGPHSSGYRVAARVIMNALCHA